MRRYSLSLGMIIILLSAVVYYSGFDLLYEQIFGMQGSGFVLGITRNFFLELFIFLSFLLASMFLLYRITGKNKSDQ